MADFIGEWAVKLSANASGLVQGMDQAAARTKAFSAQAITAAKTAATGVNDALNAITKVNLGAQTAQLQSMASAAVGIGAALATGGTVAIVGAIGAAAMAVASYSMASMDAVATQVKLGKQLGVTAQEAAGLQAIAARRDVSGDDMTQGLTVYSTRLAELRKELDGGKGGPMMAALGRMGINAREFINLNLPGQFAQLAAGSARLGDGMERQAAFAEILSRRGMGIANMFKEPAEDLANAGAVAARLGFTISQSQAVMVAATMREIKDLGGYIGAVFSNIGQGAAVAFAPVALSFSRALREVVQHGQPLLQFIGTLLTAPIIPFWTGLSGAVVLAMPLIKGVSSAIMSIAEAAKSVYTSVAPVFGEMFTMVASMFGTSNPIEAFGRALEAFGSGFATTMRVVGEGIKLWLDGVKTQLSGLIFMAETANKAFAAMTQQNSISLTSVLANLTIPIPGIMNAVNSLMSKQGVSAVVTKPLPGFDANGAGSVGWNTVSDRVAQQSRMIGWDRESIERRELLDRKEGTTWAEMENLVGNQIARNNRENAASLSLLVRQTSELGLSARELDMMQARRKGETAELQRQRSLQWDINEGRRAMLDLQNRAERVREQMRTPLQRFNDEVIQLQDMFPNGGNAFDRAMADQFRRLEGNANAMDRNPAAVMRGSVAEAQAINQAMRQDRIQNRDPQERVRLVLERIERQEQAQLEEARLLRRAVENQRAIEIMGP